MASVTDPKTPPRSAQRQAVVRTETPGHIDEVPMDELRKLICMSWAAYLDENPRVITDHEMQWYLDCENCPFSSNLALGETLSSGFMGCSERLKLVQFMSSDTVATANPNADAQAFIASSEDNTSLYISFRGTSSVTDLLNILNSAKARWEPSEDSARGSAGPFACLDCLCPKSKPMVHLGWYNVYLALQPLYDEFKRLAKNPALREICFCGHSSGGVLATMCMTQFFEETQHEMRNFVTHGTQLKLLTIGQPRLGDDVFQEHFYDVSNVLRQASLLRIYRIVNNKDLCVQIPPTAAGFSHVGVPICFLMEGTVKGKVGTSIAFGEDNVKDEREAFTEMGVADFDIYEREMYNINHEFEGTTIFRDLDAAKLMEVRQCHDPMTYYRLMDACKDLGAIRASSVKIRERPKVKKNPSLLNFNLKGKGGKSSTNAPSPKGSNAV